MNETTAEEVEETDIPGISVDRSGYSRGCNRGCCSRGFLHWQSWFSGKPSRIVRFTVLVVSLRETSNISSPVSDVSTGRHWICSHDLFFLDVLHHDFLFFHGATGNRTAYFCDSLNHIAVLRTSILMYKSQKLLHRTINNVCVAYRKVTIINVYI